MRRAPFLVATAAASVLLLAACGGDDETTSSASSPATTEAMPEAEDSNTASSQTITELVAGNPEFSTLLAAVEAAGLAETLSGDGPFTVFAPTDAAFAELPAGTLDTLLQPENQDQLTSILTYHVVPAEVMAADVEAGEVPTVNSAPFTVALDGEAVAITDGQGNQANVIETDIDASNGVVHVIDSVLLPAA
ncbi:MAG TPA: fasciclin domain-containing protein [Jiangellaceae bacterium]|nr:fasciclin domain-containing protein [Jiangellaceae bacterium]